VARDPFRFMRTVAGSFFPARVRDLLLLPEPILRWGATGRRTSCACRGEGTVESVTPDPPRVDNVSQERLERWRTMSPEERERIRERYRR